jgi:hypothetical protein
MLKNPPIAIVKHKKWKKTGSIFHVQYYTNVKDGKQAEVQA